MVLLHEGLEVDLRVMGYGRVLALLVCKGRELLQLRDVRVQLQQLKGCSRNHKRRGRGSMMTLKDVVSEGTEMPWNYWHENLDWIARECVILCAQLHNTQDEPCSVKLDRYTIALRTPAVLAGSLTKA